MAYTANDNPVFFERAKNLAILLQNFREEYARMQEWYDFEISPSAVDDEEFVDTDIATVAEAKTLLSVCAEVEKVFSNQSVSAGFRGFMLLPFLTNDPQI